MLPAYGARRWLARSAAGLRLIRNQRLAAASACTSLVACLPGLEHVELKIGGPEVRGDLGCLLQALAWCPRLRSLSLTMHNGDTTEEVAIPSLIMRNDDTTEEVDMLSPFPAPALARLSSLTSLLLHLDRQCFFPHYTLADVVGALVPLTGLAELYIGCPQYASLPAALGQLQGLRVLEFYDIRLCGLEAGCLDLPNLQGLAFLKCEFRVEEALPGLSALQHLTRMETSKGQGPLVFDPQFVQLPRLRRLVMSRDLPFDKRYSTGPLRLPGDMGLLSSTLLHLDISGNKLTPFPLAVTQLVALEHLNATENDFTEVPAGITHATMLPGVTALQSLTRIEFWSCEGQVSLAQFDRLSLLQHVVFETGNFGMDPPWLLNLPADIGSLSSTLLRLSLTGLKLAQFPLALTQLVALECLQARGNGFADVPAGITALSRLTELALGHLAHPNHPLHPLDVVAMGDLSGFPTLRTLNFACCKVRLCMTLQSGAVRHASLASIVFELAHPTPECALMVLQLSRELKGNSMLVLAVGDESYSGWVGLEPFFIFKAAMEFCAL